MLKIQITKNAGGRVVDRVKQGKANSSNVQKSKTCSFRGDMLISTLTGYKAIENINIGDFILAKNEIAGKLNYQSVTNKYSNQYDQSVYIEVWDNQGNQQTLVSNKIHPFFTKVNQANNPQPSSEGYVYQGNMANGAWVDD
ncbi:filamentous hemagglutinin [Moraxella cuniculi DSM 21768]|uniref:Filamentous hemagglutinin n=2 Tax=Moraxella cuniculi TaxID=34061 RepID=A0A1N7FYY2_9GAMM|nr:hypothetical protein B0189_08755 [Moraxella cuniculi]SIS05485.1 filamentous hemagglutinin [Moraxella cuniculi DSM 21768]